MGIRKKVSFSMRKILLVDGPQFSRYFSHLLFNQFIEFNRNLPKWEQRGTNAGMNYEIDCMFMFLKKQYYLCGHGEYSEASESSEPS